MKEKLEKEITKLKVRLLMVTVIYSPFFYLVSMYILSKTLEVFFGIQIPLKGNMLNLFWIILSLELVMHATVEIYKSIVKKDREFLRVVKMLDKNSKLTQDEKNIIIYRILFDEEYAEELYDIFKTTLK